MCPFDKQHLESKAVGPDDNNDDNDDNKKKFDPTELETIVGKDARGAEVNKAEILDGLKNSNMRKILKDIIGEAGTTLENLCKETGISLKANNKDFPTESYPLIESENKKNIVDLSFVLAVMTMSDDKYNELDLAAMDDAEYTAIAKNYFNGITEVKESAEVYDRDDTIDYEDAELKIKDGAEVLFFNEPSTYESAHSYYQDIRETAPHNSTTNIDAGDVFVLGAEVDSQTAKLSVTKAKFERELSTQKQDTTNLLSTVPGSTLKTSIMEFIANISSKYVPFFEKKWEENTSTDIDYNKILVESRLYSSIIGVLKLVTTRGMTAEQLEQKVTFDYANANAGQEKAYENRASRISKVKASELEKRPKEEKEQEATEVENQHLAEFRAGIITVNKNASGTIGEFGLNDATIKEVKVTVGTENFVLNSTTSSADRADHGKFIIVADAKSGRHTVKFERNSDKVADGDITKNFTLFVTTVKNGEENIDSRNGGNITFVESDTTPVVREEEGAVEDAIPPVKGTKNPDTNIDVLRLNFIKTMQERFTVNGKNIKDIAVESLVDGKYECDIDGFKGVVVKYTDEGKDGKFGATGDKLEVELQETGKIKKGIARFNVGAASTTGNGATTEDIAITMHQDETEKSIQNTLNTVSPGAFKLATGGLADDFSKMKVDYTNATSFSSTTPESFYITLDNTDYNIATNASIVNGRQEVNGVQDVTMQSGYILNKNDAGDKKIKYYIKPDGDSFKVVNNIYKKETSGDTTVKTALYSEYGDLISGYEHVEDVVDQVKFKINNSSITTAEHQSVFNEGAYTVKKTGAETYHYEFTYDNKVFKLPFTFIKDADSVGSLSFQKDGLNGDAGIIYDSGGKNYVVMDGEVYDIHLPADTNNANEMIVNKNAEKTFEYISEKTGNSFKLESEFFGKEKKHKDESRESTFGEDFELSYNTPTITPGLLTAVKEVVGTVTGREREINFGEGRRSTLIGKIVYDLEGNVKDTIYYKNNTSTTTGKVNTLTPETYQNDAEWKKKQDPYKVSYRNKDLNILPKFEYTRDEEQISKLTFTDKTKNSSTETNAWDNIDAVDESISGDIYTFLGTIKGATVTADVKDRIGLPGNDKIAEYAKFPVKSLDGPDADGIFDWIIKTDKGAEIRVPFKVENKKVIMVNNDGAENEDGIIIDKKYVSGPDGLVVKFDDGKLIVKESDERNKIKDMLANQDPALELRVEGSTVYSDLVDNRSKRALFDIELDADGEFKKATNQLKNIKLDDLLFMSDEGMFNKSPDYKEYLGKWTDDESTLNSIAGLGLDEKEYRTLVNKQCGEILAQPNMVLMPDVVNGKKCLVPQLVSFKNGKLQIEDVPEFNDGMANVVAMLKQAADINDGFLDVKGGRVADGMTNVKLVRPSSNDILAEVKKANGGEVVMKDSFKITTKDGEKVAPTLTFKGGKLTKVKPYKVEIAGNTYKTYPKNKIKDDKGNQRARSIDLTLTDTPD